MILGGFQFQFVCEIEPLRSETGLIHQCNPQARYKNVRGVPINKYGEGPFCKFSIPNNFRQTGVYAFTVGGDVMYVGECANLSSRFNSGYGNISPKNCFKGGQETNCRVNNLVYQFLSSGNIVSLWFHHTADHKLVETRLRETLKSSWNRV